MDELSFFDLVWIYLVVALVQFLGYYVIGKIKDALRKKEENTLYILKINGRPTGEFTLRECEETRKNMDFDHTLRSGRCNKCREYRIEVDKG